MRSARTRHALLERERGADFPEALLNGGTGTFKRARVIIEQA